jgi:hypothetical protein
MASSRNQRSREVAVSRDFAALERLGGKRQRQETA